MDATFIGLLQSQINTLQECESSADSNFVILETIKLLINNTDLSEKVISTYDKFALRRLFALYGDVGKKVCSFYEDEKEQLDPSALNGSIGKTIMETSSQILETTEAFDELSSKEKVFLEKEAELKILNEKYQSLQEKTSSLKAIAETVSEAVIDALKNENEQMEKEIKKLEKKKEIVDKRNKELTKLLEEIESANTTVDEKCGTIKTNIIEIINKHHSEIEALYKDRSLSLEEIKAEIEKFIKDFEMLDASVLEYMPVKAFYESWLGENSMIVDKMRKYGLESIEQLAEALIKAKENVEYELSAYDAILRKVVEQEEAAREAIEKKQNKVV